MSGAILQLPNTPSWRGVQLKKSTGTTLPSPLLGKHYTKWYSPHNYAFVSWILLKGRTKTIGRCYRKASLWKHLERHPIMLHPSSHRPILWRSRVDTWQIHSALSLAPLTLLLPCLPQYSAGALQEQPSVSNLCITHTTKPPVKLGKDYSVLRSQNSLHHPATRVAC
jgi:hypothetical protein